MIKTQFVTKTKKLWVSNPERMFCSCSAKTEEGHDPMVGTCLPGNFFAGSVNDSCAVSASQPECPVYVLISCVYATKITAIGW